MTLVAAFAAPNAGGGGASCFRHVPSGNMVTSLWDCVALPTPQIIRSFSGLENENVSLSQQEPVLMPWVGFGTYHLGSASYDATLQALQAGYALLDTAFVYSSQTTELRVGEAIQEYHQNNRSNLFVTTKQWRSHHGYDATRACLTTSLQRLQLEHVDLYLIHWPGPIYDRKSNDDGDDNEAEFLPKSKTRRLDMVTLRSETWRAMEDALLAGQVRAIGVSNFSVRHLEALKKSARLWPPAVNQVEFHPYHQQKGNGNPSLEEYCRKEGIVLQAYASMGGQDGTKKQWKTLGGKLTENPIIREIAQAHSKSPSQVLLKWALQQNWCIIPKTKQAERLRENASIFDFSLSDAEMDSISSLDRGDEGRLCWRGDPLRPAGF